MNMRTLHNPTSLLEYLAADRKTAVLFVLSACPFCRAFRPLFEKYAADNQAAFDALVAVLDDFDNPLWNEYSVNVVPTLVVLEAGKPVLRLDGKPGEGLNEEDLKRILE